MEHEPEPGSADIPGLVASTDIYNEVESSLTRTGDAWSLNIILDPYLHSCPASISKQVSQQTRVICGSFPGALKAESPSFISFITPWCWMDSPKIQQSKRQAPGGWKRHFQMFQENFQAPHLAQVLKSTKEPKPQQDFQRSSAPNVAPT